MKKLICFSIWGDNPIYTIGAIKNAELAKKYYPDWICKYYIGENVPDDILHKLDSFNNTIVEQINNNGGWDKGTLWRFKDISKNDVEVMISRDTDSRLNSRELAAVNEWLESDKAFHIMRDHPYHAVPILAGMFGCKRNTIYDINGLIENYKHTSNKQNDQNFLKDIIYPAVRNSSLVHDEYFEKKPFPTKRKPGLFVGQAFDQHDNELNPEHAKLL